MNELAGVRVKPDAALLETLVYLTEYPTPITGSFDPQFLELPEEVLVTVMRHHQKYFSVEDAEGKLAPQFVAVMNIAVGSATASSAAATNACCAPASTTRASSGSPTRRRSWPTACRIWRTSPSRRKLGSYLEKTERMVALVKELGGDAHAARAAELAKCDLTTELVKEFTELQGVVGGLYARAQGEPEPVWQAIYDHYKPESMEDSIPRNRTGQIVSLADKLDTLRGCFRVGLIPIGLARPVRAAARGAGRGEDSGRRQAANCRCSTFSAAIAELQSFLRRPRPLLLPRHPRLHVRRSERRHGRAGLEQPGGSGSAPGAHPEPAVDARFRAAGRQLQAHPQHSRAGRIRRRRPAPSTNPCSKPGPERDLYDEYRRIAGQPIESVISRLRPKVDLFFDKVLVNAPDPRVRQNRLTLLHTLLPEFSNDSGFF